MSDASNINVNQELAYKSSLILFNQYIANASKFLNTSKSFPVQSECNIDLIVSLPAQPKTLVNTGLVQRLTVEFVARTMPELPSRHLSLLAPKLKLSINVLKQLLGLLTLQQIMSNRL